MGKQFSNKNQSTIGKTRGRLSAPVSPLNDKIFKGLLILAIILVCFLLAGMLFSLFTSSVPSIREFGIHFFTGSTWDPVSGEFGVLPFIVGTLLTSLLALLISIPFSFAIALFLGEYFNSGFLATILNSAMELLAGIPSIIYGMWGFFVLAPLIRSLETALGVVPYGVGVFTASLVLALMIIPYTASLAREVIGLVPHELKEAAYSLGATRYETVKKVILPYSSSGVLAGVLLSFGRALGETMAVTMLIGNSYFIPKGIFDTGNTIASVIANEFTEATGEIYLSSLIQMGLVLFLITVCFGVLGRFIINKMSLEE